MDRSVFTVNSRWRNRGHFGFHNCQKDAHNDRTVTDRAILPMHINRNTYSESKTPISIHQKYKMATWRPSWIFRNYRCMAKTAETRKALRWWNLATG